jgi:hypothetical protein
MTVQVFVDDDVLRLVTYGLVGGSQDFGEACCPNLQTGSDNANQKINQRWSEGQKGDDIPC